MSNGREYLIPRDIIKVADTNFPTMWNDMRFGAHMGDFHEYREDFTTFTESQWTLTKVGTGTVIAGALRGGQISMTNSAADNDNLNLQLEQSSGVSNCPIFPQSGKLIFAEFRFAQQTDATQSDIVIGLAGTGTTDAVGTPPTDGIFFRKDDGDTQLDFVSTRNGNSSVEVNIATFVPTAFFKVGFKISGIEMVEFFVNDVKKGEFKSNIPTPSGGLTPIIAIQNGEAVAKRLFVDYIHIAQER